jgi:thiamine pyrophosphokinase
MEFRGLKRRGGILSAILVLEGAKRDELKRTSALCAMMADRCLLVAVDGGLRTCRAARRRPDLFVGDGDSLKRKVPTDIPSILFPQDKDFSDLAGALDAVRERKVQIVSVAGLTGGRVDHEWANLLELAGHARSFAGIIAPTDRGTIVLTSRGYRAATVRGRTFSLFALSSTSTVTLTGARWELHRRRLRPGSHGLSNVTGTELDLTVHTGVVALVLLPPRRKRARARTQAAESAGPG